MMNLIAYHLFHSVYYSVCMYLYAPDFLEPQPPLDAASSKGAQRVFPATAEYSLSTQGMLSDQSCAA